MWRDLVISQDFCLTAVLLQLSLYFLLVLQAPPPKSSPNLHKCTLTPDCPRKRERLAKRWQLAIAASQLAVSLAKKNFKKILWDQGSTNEPARRLGGLWRLRDFLYSHCFDSLIFSHGMQFLLSSTCKIHNTQLVRSTILCCFHRPISDHVMVPQRTVSFKCPRIELRRRDWYNEGHKCWDTSVKWPLFA